LQGSTPQEVQWEPPPRKAATTLNAMAIQQLIYQYFNTERQIFVNVLFGKLSINLKWLVNIKKNE